MRTCSLELVSVFFYSKPIFIHPGVHVVERVIFSPKSKKPRSKGAHVVQRQASVAT